MDAARTEPGTGDTAQHERAGLGGPGGDGLADQWRTAWEGLRGSLHERLQLLTLEARLAGLALVQLIFYAVVAGVLVVTAWLALNAGVVAGLVNAGLHWAVGLAIGIVLNLAVAVLLVRSMAGLVHRMDFEATLRRLRGRSRSDST
jgi:hypothetical protein